MNTPRAFLHLAAVAAFTGLALPGSASADDFCVNRDGCAPDKTFGPGGLQPALSAAAAHFNWPGRDRVLVGPGLYPAPDGAGFEYSGDTVEVIGAGSGEGGTKLTGWAGNSNRVLALYGPGNRVAGMHIEVPQGADNKALTVTGAVEDVRIDAPNPVGAATGIVGGAGDLTLDDVSVKLPSDPPSGFAFTFHVAVSSTGGPNLTVRDSTLEAYHAVSSTADETLVHRVRATAVVPVASWSRTTRVDSSLMTVKGDGAGVIARATRERDAGLTVSGCTIIGGAGTNTGVIGMSEYAGRSTYAGVYSTLVRNIDQPLHASTSDRTATANVYADYSDFLPARNTTRGDGASIDLGTHNLLAADDPRWVTQSGADAYRLRHDSPLIDAGMPSAIVGESPLDLAGLARVANGDSTGDARRDIGAFEYQRRAPVAAASAAPQVAPAGEPIAFDASGSSDADPGESLTYAWSWDDGSPADSGATATHAFATPGEHQATLTVTDAAGVASTREVTVTVQPAAGPDPVQQGAAGSEAPPQPGSGSGPRQDPDAGIGYRLVGVQPGRKGLDLVVSVANTTSARREVSVGGIEKQPTGKRPKSFRFTAVRRYLSAGRTTKIVLRVPKKLAPALKRQIVRRGKVARKPRIVIKDLASGQTRTYTPKVVSKGKKDSGR